MATPRAKVSPATPPPAERVVAREPVKTAAEVAAETGTPLIPGRVVALTRDGKPVQRAAAESGVDMFYIPPHLPPAGWSWEYKRETCVGMTDPQYLTSLQQVGWEHVRYESYPGVFAPVIDPATGNTMVGPVRKHGQMLMERAIELTKEAQVDERRKADEKVGRADRQYTRLDTSGTATAQFDNTARQASYIRRSTEPVQPLPGAARQPID